MSETSTETPVKDNLSLAHERYLADPSTQNLEAVLRYLQPTINYNLVSRGVRNNPVLTNKAKIFTIRAIKSYNPESSTSLGTWVNSNLKQLSRAKRQYNNLLIIPERAQLENLRLFEAEAQLYDELNREPTVEELADYVRLPIQKIEKIRTLNKKTPADAAFISEEGEHREVLGSATPSYQKEALDYIYSDSDYVDKKLMEYRLGYGGKPIKSLDELAAITKTSTPTLSRRSKQLAFKIEDTQKSLSDLM